ncbi:C40 family peptidase [Desulfobulbus oligotrophicus]|uniref:SH3 domain-containing protein n=1 Tax=Desulfobulbus oligotrophicus TaxID=1909699 RepID=A0A7T6AR51_9BACT|nr:SH3 domain-containing C40 family peptidase [Desulfobulbus oligotrophicus]QQG66503.1 SH3 domain-containing protein [Desulfobulbus oligotrophicus]
MNRLQSNCLIGALIMAAAAGLFFLLTTWHNPSLKPQETVHQKQVCVQPTDLRSLSAVPQDPGRFAAAMTESLNPVEQQQLEQHFHRDYFTPWTASAPLFDGNMVYTSLQQLTHSTWYGENRLPIEPARLQSLLMLADMEQFPSMHEPGIVTRPAFIRVLPTTRPLYKTPDDFPFDRLQFAEIKPNEPVRLLHTSKDGAWLYVETAYANGWVEPDAVRRVDTAQREQILHAEQVVIVRDFVKVQSEDGDILPQPKIGSLYSLIREEPEYWLVKAAVTGKDRYAVITSVRIAKTDARRHPLHFSPENVTLISAELLKTPYGWGEIYRNRDCSATTRDFFLTFGILLPRNSYQQITSGPSISLSNLSNTDKKARLRELGIPFRTLLYHKGHIMLYAGLFAEQPVVLHTAWALPYKEPGCTEQLFILGKTLFTTLTAGEELPLVKGTSLDRLDSMLILPHYEQTGAKPD